MAAVRASVWPGNIHAARPDPVDLVEPGDDLVPTGWHWGRGVAGTVDDHIVAIGNPGYLEALAIDLRPLRGRAESLRREGQTVMFVAVDGQLAALIGVADPVKPTTAEAIRALHREGIKLVMLTGDNRTTAEAVARSVGIVQVEADVLPDQKARGREAAAEHWRTCSDGR